MMPLFLTVWLTQSMPSADASNPLPALLPEATVTVGEAAISLAPEVTSALADLTPRVSVVGAATRNCEELFDRFSQVGDRQKSKTRLQSEWAAVAGQWTIRDPNWVRDDPAQRGQAWATNETLKLNLHDNVFVFGAVDVESPSVELQQLRWLGKTGVGVKVRPWLLNELQLSGGQAVRNTDDAANARGEAPDRPELFLEVSTKVGVPLVGSINIEYSGTSIPAAVVAERDRINQNVKLALPYSEFSQFHVGARWHSVDAASSTPFIDRAQLYLGVQLKR